MTVPGTSDNKPRPIANESLAEALVTVADTSLDAALGSNLLDNVPVLGVLTKLSKAALEIQEEFRLKKLTTFLAAAGKCSVASRENLRKELGGSEGQESLGARLLVLVERAEDLEKPKILGRLLVAYAEGAFDLATLWRLSRMVDRSHSEDLAFLSRFYTGPQPAEEIVTVQCLAANGFLYQIGFDGGDLDAPETGGVLFEISDLGQLLLKHGLDG